MIKRRLFFGVAALVILTLASGACAGKSGVSQEGSMQTAKGFVEDEATFHFDGIRETLELAGSMAVVNGWEFTFEFDCRQAGYGDRTGQMLAQVITHHKAVITVGAGAVKSAIMDDTWNMMLQQEVAQPPSPPAGVPAASNDSIVTAKVIDVTKVSGNFSWEIVIEIQGSVDVPGYVNFTKDKVGEVITASTQEDMSQIKKGQLITAKVRLEGDERTRLYIASNIK